MRRSRSIGTHLVMGLGLSAALLLPFSGLEAAAIAASPSPQAGVAASPQWSAPAEGSVNPSGGTTAGGTEVTITVDNPPSFVSAALGNGFGAALTDDGLLAMWSGSGEDANATLLDASLVADQGIAQLVAGNSAYLLTESGNLYRWDPGASDPVTIPTAPFGAAITQIVAAGSHLVVLNAEGQVAVLDPAGQVHEVSLDSPVLEAAASSTSVVFRTSEGAVWVGHVDTFLTDGLVRVQGEEAPQSEPASYSFTQLAAGDGWFGAIDAAGDVFTWGYEEAPAQDAAGLPFSEKLAMSGETAVVLSSGGEVFSWGRGDGPAAVDLVALGGAPSSLAASQGALSLVAGGSVFVWGPETGFTSPTVALGFWPAEVTFADVAAANVAGLDRHTVTAKAPAAEAAGTVDLTVTYSAPSGSLYALADVVRLLPDAFSYEHLEDEDPESEGAAGASQEAPAPMARSMGGISPMSLSADPSPKSPTTVWTETFDNGAPTYTGTNTGTLTNYVGIPPNSQTPAGAAGSGWNDIKNCVGIRLNHDVTLPNTALPLIGNDSYCGRVTGYAGLSLTLNRTTWWNVARGYANGLGGPTNNVASYISHANVTTSNIGAWNQTPVYETRGINFASPSLGWDADGRVQSRFYSGSFAAAASGTIGDQARLGMWIYPSGGPAARAANLFPTRVLPVTQGANAGTAPSPTPSGAAAVRAGTYTSTKNMLFQRSELQNFVLKITNDNGSSGGNDFAIDDVSLIDVTPSLHKEYVADNEQVYGANGQDKLVRIRSGDDRTANLIFRITNTTDFQAKDGWGFTETLPAGLTADAAGATFEGCGTNPTVTGSSTLLVSGGKLNAGSANATCKVTVPVTADAFKKYSTAGTLPTGGGTGTSAMKGVYDPNGTSIEFWQFDLGKEAFSDATDVNGASFGNEDARVNPGDTVTYTLELKNPGLCQVLWTVERLVVGF